MYFGPLNEITHATTLEEARLLVQRAAEFEQELYVQVCNIHNLAPKGARGYTRLQSIADCIRAIDLHKEKIIGYTEEIKASGMNLDTFNKSQDTIQQHMDSVAHLFPSEAKSPHVPEKDAPAPVPVKHTWFVRLWCWWNFRR